MVTLAEMKRDGWKPCVIAGLKCIRLVEDTYTFVTTWNGKDTMSRKDIARITTKLGKPHKIHTLGGQVTTLEY